jgi:hypothetical protein
VQTHAQRINLQLDVDAWCTLARQVRHSCVASASRCKSPIHQLPSKPSDPLK